MTIKPSEMVQGKYYRIITEGKCAQSITTGGYVGDRYFSDGQNQTIEEIDPPVKVYPVGTVVVHHLAGGGKPSVYRRVVGDDANWVDISNFPVHQKAVFDCGLSCSITTVEPPKV